MHYAIVYQDDTGAELDAVEIYKGVPIFHCPENDDYFWIADTGKPVYWSCLSHARGGIGSYQVHNHTRAWISHERSARADAHTKGAIGLNAKHGVNNEQTV